MAVIRFFPSLFLKVSLYKLRERGCVVEISHQIIVLVCLCIGGYYITLIYRYCLSFGREGFILGVSAGCQPPYLQGVAVVRLSMVGLAGTVSPVGEQSVSDLYWELGAMCVCGWYMKMVLRCMEASLCVSICCGPDF